MLYEQIGGILFYLEDFNLEACNVCKALMRGSHNLLAYVKVTKNVEGPSC
jgi:hypothetical protein